MEPLSVLAEATVATVASVNTEIAHAELVIGAADAAIAAADTLLTAMYPDDAVAIVDDAEIEKPVFNVVLWLSPEYARELERILLDASTTDF